MESIHVCFALHDEQGFYSKYLGVAIMSLCENTNANVCIHLICDDTVSKKNMKCFYSLAEQYGSKIIFYKIKTSCFYSFKERVASMSIGTLFRLQILDILPSDLQRIIYLDDDLIINMDVSELWMVDLTNYILAACRDPALSLLPKPPYPCIAGWVKEDDYFNAGVMVINLKELRRKDNFAEMSIGFLEENQECSLLDQDVFNVFFNGHVLYLPSYCNMFSRLMRQKKNIIQRGICHLSGDYVNSEQPYWFDEMFFEYWKRSPWSSGAEILPYFLKREQHHAQQILLWQKIVSIRISGGRPFVIWGVSSVIRNRLLDVCPKLFTPDWFIDNNGELYGETLDGKEIKSPKTLLDYCEIKPFVLVFSKKYYHTISSTLMYYGYREDIDYSNGALLLLQSQGGIFVGY